MAAKFLCCFLGQSKKPLAKIADKGALFYTVPWQAFL